MAKDIEVAEPSVPDELTADEAELMEKMAQQARKNIDIKTDVRLPALALVQSTSGWVEQARPGQLIHTLTGEAMDEAEVVISTMFKSRIRFSSEIGEAPLCTSGNALDGFGDPGDQLEHRGPNGGGDCTRCPESVPRQGSCKLRYNYLGILMGEGRDWENELPVGFFMQSTSIKVASRLNSLLLDAKYPWSHVLKLSARREENDRGKYYVWQVNKARPAVMREMLRAAKISDQMSKAQTISIEDREEPEPRSGVRGKDDIPF